MAAGSALNLRWVAPREQVGSLAFERDTLNALAAVKAASLLLQSRWEQLSPEQRRELSESLSRRVLELEDLVLALAAAARQPRS